jgi:hypothetical protein
MWNQQSDSVKSENVSVEEKQHKEFVVTPTNAIIDPRTLQNKTKQNREVTHSSHSSE